MSESFKLVASPWDESEGSCACCGNRSKTIWGGIYADEVAVATYFVHWTVNAPEHMPNFDFVIGRWGDGASVEDRFLVSLVFKPGRNGGAFMVIDGKERWEKHSQSCARAMQRADVIGTDLAADVFALVDTLWLTDSRMAEVRELNNAQ